MARIEGKIGTAYLAVASYENTIRIIVPDIELTGNHHWNY